MTWSTYPVEPPSWSHWNDKLADNQYPKLIGKVVQILTPESTLDPNFYKVDKEDANYIKISPGDIWISKNRIVQESETPVLKSESLARVRVPDWIPAPYKNYDISWIEWISKLNNSLVYLKCPLAMSGGGARTPYPNGWNVITDVTPEIGTSNWLPSEWLEAINYQPGMTAKVTIPNSLPENSPVSFLNEKTILVKSTPFAGWSQETKGHQFVRVVEHRTSENKNPYGPYDGRIYTVRTDWLRPTAKSFQVGVDPNFVEVGKKPSAFHQASNLFQELHEVADQQQSSKLRDPTIEDIKVKDLSAQGLSDLKISFNSKPVKKQEPLISMGSSSHHEHRKYGGPVIIRKTPEPSDSIVKTLEEQLKLVRSEKDEMILRVQELGQARVKIAELEAKERTSQETITKLQKELTETAGHLVLAQAETDTKQKQLALLQKQYSKHPLGRTNLFSRTVFWMQDHLWIPLLTIIVIASLKLMMGSPQITEPQRRVEKTLEDNYHSKLPAIVSAVAASQVAPIKTASETVKPQKPKIFR